MTNDDQITIKEARDKMRPNLRIGCVCPACGQTVKMYARPLTSSMAYALILLFNNQPPFPHYVHLEDLFKPMDIPSSIRADVPKLRFWNLIEPEAKCKAEDGNPNNGMYRITDLGRAFVENRIQVVSHVNLYNNRMFGYPEHSKQIGIIEALKNKFNYSEIIKK